LKERTCTYRIRYIASRARGTAARRRLGERVFRTDGAGRSASRDEFACGAAGTLIPVVGLAWAADGRAARASLLCVHSRFQSAIPLLFKKEWKKGKNIPEMRKSQVRKVGIVHRRRRTGWQDRMYMTGRRGRSRCLRGRSCIALCQDINIDWLCIWAYTTRRPTYVRRARSERDMRATYEGRAVARGTRGARGLAGVWLVVGRASAAGRCSGGTDTARLASRAE
jgi:hypothetical protein